MIGRIGVHSTVGLAIACAFTFAVSAWANTFQTAGDWHVPGNWSGGSVPVDGEDVVIAANVSQAASSAVLSSYTLNAGISHTFQGSSTALTATNVTINGTITHDLNTDTAAPWVADNRVWIVCTNLTLSSTGLINANSKGYQCGYGPGVGLHGGGGWYGGGGYGGVGGVGLATVAGTGGAVYGDDLAPADPGSGGGGTGGVGHGGGWVTVQAGGLVTINGTIQANGGVDNGGGGQGSGSGGTIYIACGAFAGSNGVIMAKGGNNTSPGALSGSGGGGRIAIVYDTTAQATQNSTARPVVTISARQGSGTTQGQSGTVYMSDSSFFPDALNMQGARIVIPGFTSWSLDRLVLPSGLVMFPDGFSLYVTNNVILSGDGGLAASNGAISIGGNLARSNAAAGRSVSFIYGGAGAAFDVAGNVDLNQGSLNLFGIGTDLLTVNIGGHLAMTNASALYAYAGPTNGVSTNVGLNVIVAGDLLLSGGSWVYPSAATNGAAPYFQMYNLALQGGAGSGFDASQRGYGSARGLGQGGVGDGGFWGGSGHGGVGGVGNVNGPGGGTYGNSNAPVLPGSGGMPGASGGKGGGTIWINVANAATINGTMKANGGPGDGGGGSGAGSGGGLYLTCRSLSGTNGILTALGGNNSSLSGAGGGGRIAVWRAPQLDTATTGTWTIAASGGTGSSAPYNGGPGTIVWGALVLPVEPSISNSVVSGITASSATLNGYVASTGSADTAVTVYWGTTDAGTNANPVWEHTNTFAGAQNPGPIGTNVPVSVNTLYYYRYFASNVGGSVWAPDPPGIFYVGEVNVTATDSNAAEAALDPGVFTVARPVAATNGPVTVTYTITGSASNGVDYNPLNGVVSMGVGVSSATITVTPIADANASEGQETVIVTLGGDAYLIGASNAATVTIDDQPVAPYNNWAGTGNWTNPAFWSAGHKPVDGQFVTVTGSVTLTESSANLSGFVISNGSLTVSNWSSRLTATDVVIGSNATVTLAPAFGALAMSNRVWIVCTNFAVLRGGAINVDGKGWLHDVGLGLGTAGNGYYGGAGHGGRGGEGNGGAGSGGPTYGSVTAPTEPGTGGTGPNGGAGGGVVRIDASEHMQIDGLISARGGDEIENDGYSGGAGGSIWISCRTFGGTNGTLHAGGGSITYYAGAGGGGRVSLVYDTAAQASLPKPAGLTIACNQGGGRYSGAPGSVYLSDTNFYPTASLQGGDLMIPGFTSWTIDSLAVTTGRVAFPPGFQLTVTGSVSVTGNGGLWLSNSVAAIGGSLLLNNTLAQGADTFFLGGPAAAYSIGGDTVLNQGTLYLRGTAADVLALTMAGDLVVTNTSRIFAYASPSALPALPGLRIQVGDVASVAGGGWIYPQSDSTNGGSVLLQVRDLIVGAGSGFDANLRGFGPGRGPGQGGHAGGGWYGGSGYGGRGSAPNVYQPNDTGGPTYGSSTAPVHPGSGGAQGVTKGGGAIWVDASGDMTLNGSLLANGQDGTGGGGDGGASGGAIYLTCHNLRGTSATLSARGGNNTSVGGAGGGGRIAIWRVGDTSVTNGWSVSAAGGSAVFAGGDGTIVWEFSPAKGTVIMMR